jgi:heme-degrading monooxygenase HmoA
MFVVIYRWQLKPGKKSEFRDAWSQATKAIYATRGSLRPQFMEGQYGTCYGVARWPDRDTWRRRSEPEAAPILKRADSWEN